MTKKKYIVNGYIEIFIKVRKENRVYTFHFNNGSVSGSGRIPASFLTEKKEEQELIESHRMFKNGIIKIAEEIQMPDEEVEKKNVAITTLQQAREVLIANGASMSELQNKQAVLETAKKMNIDFPNLK